jgi:hypothetical protein
MSTGMAVAKAMAAAEAVFGHEASRACGSPGPKESSDHDKQAASLSITIVSYYKLKLF